MITGSCTSVGNSSIRVGTRIHVMANVGCGEDVALAAAYGADGIRLFRTEFLYLTCRSAPTEDELYERISEALAPMKGRPITLRLLEAGGDKLLPFLRLPAFWGEAAGPPEMLAGFLQMGITTVSVAPPLIPLIKNAVREFAL